MADYYVKRLADSILLYILAINQSYTLSMVGYFHLDRMASVGMPNADVFSDTLA